MPHGTDHGIGMDVHEPPLLDLKGSKLIIAAYHQNPADQFAPR